MEQTPAYVLARALFESPEVEEAVAFNFKWTVRVRCMRRPIGGRAGTVMSWVARRERGPSPFLPPTPLHTTTPAIRSSQEPSEAELEDFLINQLGFNPDRVKSGIAKLKVRSSHPSLLCSSMRAVAACGLDWRRRGLSCVCVSCLPPFLMQQTRLPTAHQASRGAMQQKRLDSFFKSTGVSSSSAGVKRKVSQQTKNDTTGVGGWTPCPCMPSSSSSRVT